MLNRIRQKFGSRSRGLRKLPTTTNDLLVTRAVAVKQRRPGGALLARRQEISGRRFGTLRLWFRAKIKLGLVLLGVIVGFGVIAGMIYFLHSQKTYLIQEVVVQGNQQTPSLAIVSLVDEIAGDSLLLLSTSYIEQRLLAAFPYLKEVTVSKVLPGKLIIDIAERFPVAAVVNLAGVYMVDAEGVVVTVVTEQEAVELTESQRIVISGFGDPNAEYTKEKFLAGIADSAERAKVDWGTVPLEQKQTALVQLREDLLTTVGALRGALLESFAVSSFTATPVVLYLDSVNWDLGKSVDKSKFKMVNEVINFSTQSDLVINQLSWDSDFTLRLQTGGLAILFSSTRSLESQFTDLVALQRRLDLSGAVQIDLRSEVVAVR